MIAVVDTNVLMVANKKNKAASPQCIQVCADKLHEIASAGKVVLDDGWRILHEYGKHLNPSGQPGFGDFFYKWVLTNRKNPLHCELVKITPLPSDIENFLEFPGDESLADFDPSDRKFIAVSMSHSQHPPVLQALDSEWWHFRAELEENGINVVFLCEIDISRI
ncbi:MAG: hypothetical protein NT166_22170 [Candidatus Aminicenantes bacterium]|nr:hypothetical protein [Candidatus Aminicenantes bacterium]